MPKRTTEARLEEKLARRAKLDEQIERLDNPLVPMMRRVDSAVDDMREVVIEDKERHASIVAARNAMLAAVRGYRAGKGGG